MKNILLVILMFLCISCSTTKTVYVPVEKIKTEYVNSIDSVYCYDSIYYFMEYKKDTVFETKYKYKVLEKYKTDTIIKVDSIPVIKEIEKVVEVNHIYWWQKTLMWLGGVISILGLTCLIKKFFK